MRSSHCGGAVFVCAIATLVAISACVDDTAVGPYPRTEAESSAARPAMTGAFAHYRAMADEDLAELIGEAEEQVFIIFKEPDAVSGVDETGRSMVSSATLRSAKSQLEEMGLDIEWEARRQPTIRTRLPADRLAEIRSLPFVDIVEPVGRGNFGISQDTLWNIKQVNAPNAWFRTSGSGAKLLIIDTGIKSHTDLPAATDSNFTAFGDADADGHGTAMAGVAVAIDNSAGIVGVSPSVSLYMAKVSHTRYTLSTANVISAIEWGIDEGVDVISMSFQITTTSATLEAAINDAYSNEDILLFAASGNGAQEGAGKHDVWYPATLDSVVAVGAVDSLGAHSTGSRWGSELELVAPGEDVKSTNLSNGYTTWSGTSTSLATPHAAAVAALIKSAHPTWDNSAIRDTLKVRASGDGFRISDKLGYGIVDAENALDIPTFSVVSATSTWQYTDQCFDANASGASGYTVEYAWRFEDSGSFTTPASDPETEFLGHSSAGSPTVTLQATNTDNDADIFVRRGMTVSSGAVSVSGPDYVTDKTSKTYTATYSGDWYERWSSDPCNWGLKRKSNATTYNRIWPAGYYTVDLRNTKNVSNVLRRGRHDIEVCWECGGGGETQVVRPASFSVSPSTGDVGDDWGMFGGGPWISSGTENAVELARFYDISGQHEPGSAFAESTWLGAAGGLNADNSDRWQVKWTRVSADGPDMLGIEFRVTPLLRDPYEFGMAIDPDLNDPTDDESGFDSARGMIYVKDASRTVGYMILDRAGDNALIRANEFGARRFAPGAEGDAWRAHRAPGIQLQEGPDDVQLLLSTGATTGAGTWRLWMVRGETVRDIQVLADRILNGF